MTSEDAVPERPGWLILSAWCAFLCTVPSAVWRVAMIMGWLPGTSELRDRELEQGTISGYLYVYALSIVQLGFAPQISNTKRFNKALPCFVWVTSGWN